MLNRCINYITNKSNNKNRVLESEAEKVMKRLQEKETDQELELRTRYDNQNSKGP